MSCFHRAKILMLKKRTKMHFNTDQLHAISPFRTTPLITWQYAVSLTAKQHRKKPILNAKHQSYLLSTINSIPIVFSHYHVSTKHISSIIIIKSQCRNISRISNQFRKIEFWFIPPKQPFGMVISENDIIKSPSALHLDNFRKVRKFTKKYNFCSWN